MTQKHPHFGCDLPPFVPRKEYEGMLRDLRETRLENIRFQEKYYKLYSRCTRYYVIALLLGAWAVISVVLLAILCFRQ